MLREQPSLSAWGRPAGWVPRPHVRRRAWLADTVEGLVRSHDPRRGLRTRPDHHLRQMKCGQDSAFETHQIGLSRLAKDGSTFPDEVLEAARAADGIILGPVSHSDYPA